MTLKNLIPVTVIVCLTACGGGGSGGGGSDSANINTGGGDSNNPVSGPAASLRSLEEIIPLGVFDPQRPGGDANVWPYTEFNAQGQAGGINTQMVAPYNNAAWFFDGSRSFLIGLYGQACSGWNFDNSQINGLNARGQVAGWSSSRSCETSVAWLYEYGRLKRLGLIDSAHTGNGNLRSSISIAINDQGDIIGRSNRYIAGTPAGQSAWIYADGRISTVGLSGSDFISPSGRKSSRPVAINEQRHVIGFSASYDAVVNGGEQAWLYDGFETLALGLRDGAHNRLSGHKLLLNEQGHVAGFSAASGIRGPADPLAGSAWLYDGNSTFRIGLYSPEHRRGNGAYFSQVSALNEGGQVIGSSYRFVGAGKNAVPDRRPDDVRASGQSAWLYNGNSTIKLGLIDNLHTRDGDRQAQLHEATLINDNAQVAGTSAHYNAAGAAGRSAWFYNGTRTLRLGLLDNRHTFDNGTRSSQPGALNTRGQVLGSSDRSCNRPSAETCKSAWLYDSATNRTYTITPNAIAAEKVSVYANYLGDDGAVLGRYSIQNTPSSAPGDWHAFYFSIRSGFNDLGELAASSNLNLRANGWALLQDARNMNSEGQILGIGRRIDGTQQVFVLNPAD